MYRDRPALVEAGGGQAAEDEESWTWTVAVQ